MVVETRTVVFAGAPPDVDDAAARLDGALDDISVVTVRSVEAALDRVAHDDVGCVVSSTEVAGKYGIEHLGGLELLEAVRERDEELPVILFTDVNNDEIARAAIESDVSEYLIRWDQETAYERLVNRVAAAVARRRAEERAAQHVRLNEVIRDVNETLVRASTPEEIEAGVCRRLARDDLYTDAGIWTVEGDRVASREHRGDHWPSEPVDDAVRDAIREAARTGASSVADRSGNATQTDEPVTGGNRWDLLAVPIVYTDTNYGVLAVRTARHDGITGVERAVLDELGETIAFAFDSVETRQQLTRQNERLDEFASLVSHDLRNPLTVIKGHLEVASSVDDPLEHYDAIDQAASKMERLIDELLDLAREGEDVSEAQTVDIATIARDAWKPFADGAATLTVETTVTVPADPARLTQVFENLFRNAIEHGGEDVTITVGDLGGEARGFSVADDGPGIPPDERERIFEYGYTTEDGGTGYGLAIVERIVDAHDWAISVDATEDGGARFDVKTG